MKTGLCLRMALGNIRRNYRFFLPRVLAETGLAACFYIVFTLACDRRLSEVKGGDYLPIFMWMGTVIVAFLSLVLLLYTNSFLMKQRRREFGLYHVLGLGKKHVVRILFYECAVSSLISIAAGLLFGVLFYKLASLAICRLLRAEVVAGFYYLRGSTVAWPALLFLLIDTLAFAVNAVGIVRRKTVDLLNDRKTGEKEPKTKWVLLVLGVLSLGAGYAISLTVKEPLEALLLFFTAVLLVIAGTYFLFVAGSVFVLKALKKNEKYYYRPGRMTAVSGLLWRMKQNAVGLASVAILATGVLVMISTTCCLYSRTETVLARNYPQDGYFSCATYGEDGWEIPLPQETLRNAVTRSAEKNGLSVKSIDFQQYYEVTFLHGKGTLSADTDAATDTSFDLTSLYNITFLSESGYRALGGEALSLGEGEVAVCAFNLQAPFGEESFSIFDRSYRVKKSLETFPVRNALVSVNCFGMVVSDAAFEEIYADQRAAYGDVASEKVDRLAVTFSDRAEALRKGDAFSDDLYGELRAILEETDSTYGYRIGLDSVWEARESLYGMYGTLLFLGILLGIVCLFATVLIIYYKQISEGYEDRERFQIMRKIGLSDREAKKTVRAQIMTVFFLPLLTAGIHTAFAYPILTRLMQILLLDDPFLFAKWCVAGFAAFTLVYALIYKLTSGTYYKIVN